DALPIWPGKARGPRCPLVPARHCPRHGTRPGSGRRGRAAPAAPRSADASRPPVVRNENRYYLHMLEPVKRVRTGNLRRVAGPPGLANRRRRKAAADRSARRVKCRPNRRFRSEEHTSELQSRENLVCRLLLEKKKKEE